MTTSPPQGADLREQLRLIGRRKWTILLVALLVTASAIGWSLLQDPTYVAQTRLLLNASEGDDADAAVDVNSESQLIASTEIAERVVEDLELEASPGSLLNNLDVQPVRQTRILVVTYSAQSAQAAADISNGFAEAYIDYRQDRVRKNLLRAQRKIEDRIAATEEDLDDLLDEIADARKEGLVRDVEILQNQQETLIRRLSIFEDQLTAIEPDVASKAAGGEILGAAQPPSSPSSPNHPKNAVLGLVLGLLAGVAIAFVRDRFDDRLRGIADIERATGAPVLATVPAGHGGGGAHKVVVLDNSSPAAGEAYRRLRAAVNRLASHGRLTTILVASPNVDEGKSATAATLAAALAQADRRVVVVSADLRKPELDRFFSVTGDSGLGTWLEGDAEEVGPLLRPTALDNLKVIPAGDAPGNPADLLSSPRVPRLIKALEEDFEYVILEAAPILPVADALLLAEHADGILLVIGPRTSKSDVARASDELVRNEARLVGCVVNSGAAPSGATYGSEPEKKGRSRKKKDAASPLQEA